jgi:hypothetical protein
LHQPLPPTRETGRAEPAIPAAIGLFLRNEFWLIIIKFILMQIYGRLKLSDMKLIYSYPALLIIALLLTIAGHAGNNPTGKTLVITDTLGKPAADTGSITSSKNSPAGLSQKDSLKIAKKEKRKKEKNDTTAFNPYQPNTVVKPIPYNSPKEKEKAAEKPPVPVGEIIRDVILPKKSN